MAVTVKDLAEMTGFSTSTISRVLSHRGYVDETTRKTVEKAIETSGYVYKPASNRRNSTKMIMLIMGELSNDVYARNIRGISSIFDACNEMYVGTYGDRYDAEKQEFYMRQAISSHFKGMILLSPDETPSFVRMMQNCSIPCVALNRPLESVEINQVCMDNKAAGRLAVQYLAQKGHRRILHLTIAGLSSAEYRKRGYLDGMRQQGLPVREDDVLLVEHSYEGGVRAGSLVAVAHKDITAIYTPNELLARGVIDGLRLCGKNVPGDISVLSTDNTQFSVQGIPALTCVSCNHYQMGVEAALLLLEQCKNPGRSKQQIFMTPEIIERDSVAPRP